jgi:DNA primase
MGTALTSEQVAILGKLARTVIVVFDGDDAGVRAAKKAIPLFVEAGVDGRVARMPKGVDPDDYVRTEGADAFRRLIDNARPVIDQFIDDLSKEAKDETVPERAYILEKAAPLIAAVQNPTMRAFYLGRLPVMLGVPAHEVNRAVRAAAAQRPVEVAAPAPAPQPRRAVPKQQIEAFVLLVTHPAIGNMPETDRVSELLTDPGVGQIFRTALEAIRRGETVDVPAWLDSGPADVREALGTAVMEGGWAGTEGIERAVRALVARLELSRVSDEIEEIKRQQQEALRQGDAEKARAFSLAEMELIRKKKGLSSALARP